MSYSAPFSKADNHHMQTALTLAKWGQGRTTENPSVGCVILDKNGHVVGQGRTADGGRPHAETATLQMAYAQTGAGAGVQGGTAYVTLEPCSHHGQTCPCAESLIQSGITRVVVGCLDPDSRVSGRGIALLQQAGITVNVGCCGTDAVLSNVGFFSGIIRHRPWVTVKIATTLDGKIALGNGHSQWITGQPARTYGHMIRSQNNAILVGSGTVKADNPSLTCRLPGVVHILPRVVVGNLPSKDYNIFADTAPVFHYTNGNAPVDLGYVLENLCDQGINRLMVEGGGRIIASLLQQELIDEIHWIHAPSIMGGDGLPSIGDLGVSSMESLYGFAMVSQKNLGKDTVTILRPHRALDFAHHLTKTSSLTKG